MEGKKKIIIISPSEIIIRGLKNIFNEIGEFKVIDCISDLSRTSETRLRTSDIDIVIIDTSVLDYQGAKDIRLRMSSITNAALIALANATDTEESIKQYDGYFALYDEPINIIKSIRNAYKSRLPEQDSDTCELSVREKEILACVAKGMQNKEIADLYNISIYTVITHRKNITHKTGIKTIAGLTVYALLNNLIDMSAIS